MDIEKLESLNKIAIEPLHKIIKWLLVALLVSVLGNICQAFYRSSEVNLIADDNLYSEITQTQG